MLFEKEENNNNGPCCAMALLVNYDSDFHAPSLKTLLLSKDFLHNKTITSGVNNNCDTKTTCHANSTRIPVPISTMSHAGDPSIRME
jgi:hypothetical protein